MSVCKKCGETLNEDSNFCPFCGEKVPSGGTSQNQNNNSENKQKETKEENKVTMENTLLDKMTDKEKNELLAKMIKENPELAGKLLKENEGKKNESEDEGKTMGGNEIKCLAIPGLTEKSKRVIMKFAKLKESNDFIENVVRTTYRTTESDDFSEEQKLKLIEENIYFSDINNIVEEYMKYISHHSDLFVEELRIDRIKDKKIIDRTNDFLDLFDKYQVCLSNDKFTDAHYLLCESTFLGKYCHAFNFKRDKNPA